MREFSRHKYTWSKPFMAITHNWEFIGETGGLNFWIYEDEDGRRKSGGIEIHRTNGQGAPDHTDCPLVGGRCWHDGSSLWASEIGIPVIEPMLKEGDHESIFKFLENEYRKRFLA